MEISEAGAPHMEVLPRSEDTETSREAEYTPSIATPIFEDDLEIPEGLTLPLNSKRISAARIKRLAAGLDVPTAALTDEVRQMLGEKLREMGHDPANVQVVIQGDGDVANLYLVDDSGVIKAVNGSMSAHVHESPEHVTQSESVESLRSALREARDENQRLADELTTVRHQLSDANVSVEGLRAEIVSYNAQLLELQHSLEKERQKSRRFWRQKCEVMLAHEDALEEKEAIIATLQRSQAVESRRTSVSETLVDQPAPPLLDNVLLSHVPDTSQPTIRCRGDMGTVITSGQVRRGKAPPVECFSGDDADVTWDDWLTTLERAATWNGWSESEKLLQLAGHLKGKAIQEWNLMEEADKTSYNRATVALRGRVDQGSTKLAAQDFRHAAQKAKETVAEFIHRLEKVFRRAYGRDTMATETRDALLFGQLQEGLHLGIMQAPAVSGAQSYAELCVAAKNEQRRQEEIQKRQQYHQGRNEDIRRGQHYRREGQLNQPTPPSRSNGETRPADPSKLRCFICNRTGHLKKDCRQVRRTEERPRPTRTNQVQSREPQTPQANPTNEDPLTFLQSSSDDEVVRQVRVSDKGSMTQCVKLCIQGVPVYGIIDSGADITIIGGKLFKKVALAARLKKRDFMKPDKTPRTYDQKPFTLDGRMDLDLVFEDKAMRTPVYVKMDAHDQLLLSEGVCRQLGIVSYHDKVEKWRGGSKQNTTEDKTTREAKVPTVKVQLVKTVRLLPHQSVIATVHCGTADLQENRPLLMEFQGDGLLWSEDMILQPSEKGEAQMVLSNPSGCSCVIAGGTCVGEAVSVEAVTLGETIPEELSEGIYQEQCRVNFSNVRQILPGLNTEERKKLLRELILEPDLLDGKQKQEFYELLESHHEAFSLGPQDRGETELVEMDICTGDAEPMKQGMRRMPFAVRGEVARQLEMMQESGVIQPSKSPWSSPVVMVRKRDGTHRFCVDYRKLNAVTKADTFPLPRIDDLLDQLGQAKYFSLVDLASGYWQIRMREESREKTAFTTPQGLFEFCVMPFGLTNAPSVFQRLMNRVLMGLNPVDGPEFVTVYIDDVLIFSKSLGEHLEHLELVLKRIREVGLKLKPAKCKFICEEVEYLGHLITPRGLQTNVRLVNAVKKFPCPQDVTELKRFLGLSSYYRRFIRGYASIARPLHFLTRKDSPFKWDEECQAAFEELKDRLSSAPILAYPSFDRPYTLETDASGKGIGAVLSQQQDEDGRCHPIAFASRSLNAAERNYSISELETLAVVWAISHFHAYLYGQRVTVLTDHAAVKPMLESPNPSGKHARWWIKVFGSGIKEVTITYRPGKQNHVADALSRSPTGTAPQVGIAEGEVQVAAISSTSDATVKSLLQAEPGQDSSSPQPFIKEQRKDEKVAQIIDFLEEGKLPYEEDRARIIVLQQSLFAIVDQTLYYIDLKKQSRRRVVVPNHLQGQLLAETHRSVMGGHFSGKRLYNTLAVHWWWDGMYRDSIRFTQNCPECTVVTGGSKVHCPPLHPIPVQRPFQILGIDIMELPKTAAGNRYVIVLQDFLTKWPMIFAVPDQKAHRIARLLAEEVVPFCGVPEAVLSDRGTNLLSNLVQDVCGLLGIKKLNTTSYHPQCDGMVERLNRTLKSMLRKHASQFGTQWDAYLPGVVWAYRNTVHESTGEKPSFLLFGIDLRTPTEAALLPPDPLKPADLSDYRQQLIMSLSTARQGAAECVKKAQQKYKRLYDRKATPRDYHVGDWVMIKFPSEETGKQRKLSQPWHGPYRVTTIRDPDIVAMKVYFPGEDPINVHQLRVTKCPIDLPAGYYWYGRKQHSADKTPKWLENLQGANVMLDATTVYDGTSAANDGVSADVSSKVDGEQTNSSNRDVNNSDDDDIAERSRTNTRYSLRAQVKRPARFK